MLNYYFSSFGLIIWTYCNSFGFAYLYYFNSFDLLHLGVLIYLHFVTYKVCFGLSLLCDCFVAYWERMQCAGSDHISWDHLVTIMKTPNAHELGIIGDAFSLYNYRKLEKQINTNKKKTESRFCLFSCYCLVNHLLI